VNEANKRPKPIKTVCECPMFNALPGPSHQCPCHAGEGEGEGCPRLVSWALGTESGVLRRATRTRSGGSSPRSRCISRTMAR
jgi:hypothetical protein